MVIRLPEVDFATFALSDIPSAPEPFHKLNRIPIVDNGEPLVDLRETNPEFSFATYCLPYVREGVAKALKAATRNLPDHLELKAYTALRTLEQQAEMYWGNYKRAKEEHPNWPESTVRRMTNRFFAPPDAKAPPGHCTGEAIDVGIHHRNSGEGVDVRSPLEGWLSAPTAAAGLHPESAENRRTLCYAMHSTGLSNCRDEFWHWSYGDSAWAARVGAPIACYGLVEPPIGATRVVGEKIQVVPYSPEWPLQFQSIRDELDSSLGALALRIEHVGSTSIPGLSAKPILDIDIVVEGPIQMAALIDALSAVGYQHEGDQGVLGRETFRCNPDDKFKDAICRSWPIHHLYACLVDNLELRRHLAFRDHLRSNQVAASQYAELKEKLAIRYLWDRIRYNDAKAPFVHGVLREIDPTLIEP